MIKHTHDAILGSNYYYEPTPKPNATKGVKQKRLKRILTNPTATT